MMSLCCDEASADEVLVGLRGCDALHRLLLEHVKHVDRSRQGGDVGGSIRVTVMVFDEFHDPGSEALPEWPGTLWMIAVLGVEESRAKHVLHFLRQRPEVLEARPNEVEGPALRRDHAANIATVLYTDKPAYEGVDRYSEGYVFKYRPRGRGNQEESRRRTRWVSARAPCGARPCGTPAWARKRRAEGSSRMVSGLRAEPARRGRASETANVTRKGASDEAEEHFPT